MRLAWTVLGLVGCASEAQVVADMERTLRQTQVAVVSHLLAAEVVSHTQVEPEDGAAGLRHGESCGCPCLERFGDMPPYVLTVDFPETACVPFSGMLPAPIAGHGVLQYDGSAVAATFEAFELSRAHPVSGTLDATPAPAAARDTGRFAMRGTLSVGDYEVGLDTETEAVRGERLTLDGTVTVDGTELALQGLEIPWDELQPPCPTPLAGHAIAAGRPALDVDFATPGAGLVTVTRGSRSSRSVDYCTYRELM